MVRPFSTRGRWVAEPIGMRHTVHSTQTDLDAGLTVHVSCAASLHKSMDAASLHKHSVLRMRVPSCFKCTGTQRVTLQCEPGLKHHCTTGQIQNFNTIQLHPEIKWRNQMHTSYNLCPFLKRFAEL